MLYRSDNPILKIVGVEHLNWSGDVFTVAPRDYSGLAFRISGSAVLNADDREYCVNTNDILYVPQHKGYTATYTDTEMIVIHFITQRDDPEIEVYSLQNGERLYKAFLQARAIWERREAGFSLHAMAQLYTILGIIFELETKATLPSHFVGAVSFINGAYRDNSLNTKRICEEAGIGATALRSLFQKHYQKSPTEYITDLRIEHARNLIAGGASVETAAIESGFNDPKYFARVVKKRFHCTPRDFKNYGK